MMKAGTKRYTCLLTLILLAGCGDDDDCTLTATCADYVDSGVEATDSGSGSSPALPPVTPPDRPIDLTPEGDGDSDGGVVPMDVVRVDGGVPVDSGAPAPEDDDTVITLEDSGAPPVIDDDDPELDASPDSGSENEGLEQPADSGAVSMADPDAGDVEVDAGPPPEYVLGGSVVGASGSLELAVGDEVLLISEDGAFSVDGFLEGDDYQISVVVPPPGQACDVENGTGTFGSANIADVVVTCANDVTDLSNLTIDAVSVGDDLSAVFDYDVDVSLFTQSVEVSAALLDETAALRINGVDTASPSLQEIPLPLGLTTIEVEVEAASGRTALYTIDITRADSTNSSTSLISPSPAGADGFGSRISVSGDHMFIDRSTEDKTPGGPEAFLFQRIGDEWAFAANVAQLISDPIFSILEGDLCDDSLIVAGLPTVSSATHTVYFLRYGPAGWTYEDSDAGFDTVTDVACDGDTVAIRFAGATRVYSRSSGSWEVEDTLDTPTDVVFSPAVGRLALHGDLLVAGDAADDSAARGINGNPAANCAGELNCASGSGAAYIFERNALGTWQQAAYVKASNAHESNLFGIAVDVFDGTVLIGSTREAAVSVGTNQPAPIYDCVASPSSCVVRTGAAYLFEKTGSTWQEVAFIKRLDPTYGGEFGAPVAIHGDLLVVGNFYDNGAAPNGGAAIIFHRDGGSIDELQTIYLDDPATDDYFPQWVVLNEQGLFGGVPNRGTSQDRVYWFF